MRQQMGMVLAAGILAGWAATASGYPVTFEFRGTITEIIDNGSVLPGLVEVGDTFSGSFTFDSGLIDARPEDPTYGRYEISTPGAMQVSVGEINLVSNNLQLIQVGDGAYDYYHLGSHDFIFGDFDISGMVARFSDYDATIFSSDVLPLLPPVLGVMERSSFQIEGFTLEDGDRISPGFAINGMVEYLVPEPSCVLLGLLGSLCWLRRAGRS